MEIKPMEPLASSQEGAERSAEMELVAQLRRQEERAVRMFYKKYSPRLLSRLCGMFGDLHTAEDCLQQVFIEALRSIHSFRGESSLSTWLNRITTRVAYKLFQKQKRFSSLLERASIEQDILPEQTSKIPERLLVQEQTRALVWKVLGRLSARKRMAILLCDFEGYSLEEAALHMDVPVGTVSSRLCHGRAEFQKRFSKELKRQGLSTGDLLHDEKP